MAIIWCYSGDFVKWQPENDEDVEKIAALIKWMNAETVIYAECRATTT